MFLNGNMEEEIYVKQLEGFVVSNQENKVCKLIKSLYGMKKAPKQWDQKFEEVVLSNDFVLNQSEKYVYRKLKRLSSQFFMKDLGEADVILGIMINKITEV